MKLIAVETVFIFLLGMIATITFIIFFSDVKNLIFNLFKNEKIGDEFEIEIIRRESFSENFLKELISLCKEKSIRSKLKMSKFACFYLISLKGFENIDTSSLIEVDTAFFDKSKESLLIVFDKKLNKTYLLN